MSQEVRSTMRTRQVLSRNARVGRRGTRRIVHAFWKMASVAPGVGTSFVAVLLVGQMLPDWAGLFVSLMGAVPMAALALGSGEPVAIRMLFGARRLTPSQTGDLREVIAVLCRMGLGPPVVELFVCHRDGSPAAMACGRRSVIVAKGFVEAVASGQVATGEASAVVAHACLVTRSGMSRQDPVIRSCSMPWLTLQKIGHPVGGVVGFAWRVRPIVVGVAMWQSMSDGSGAPGSLNGVTTAIVLGTMLALSYVLPRLSAGWAAHVDTCADRSLVALGFGQQMAAFLGRGPRSRSLARRISQLAAPTI